MGAVPMSWYYGGQWEGEMYTYFTVVEGPLHSDCSVNDVINNARLVIPAIRGRFKLWGLLGDSKGGQYQEILGDRDVQWFLKVISTKAFKSYGIIVHESENVNVNESIQVTVESHSVPVLPDVGLNNVVDNTVLVGHFQGATENANVVGEVHIDESPAGPLPDEEHVQLIAEDFQAKTSRCQRKDTPVCTSVYGDHDSFITFDSNFCLNLRNLIEDVQCNEHFPPTLPDDCLNIFSNVNIHPDQLFLNKSDLKKCLHIYAIKNNFQFKIIRSCSRRLEATCLNQDCGWKICARQMGRSKMWGIRRMCLDHSCSMQLITNEHRQASPYIISEYVAGRFRLAGDRGMKPGDIIQHMRFNHGVHVPYLKAWRARELCLSKIHGSAVESYARLPMFKFMICSKNPGSVVEWVVDKQERFKYLFMALHASIHGWRTCRPVLSVDGTFLKNKYGGTLLVASGLDGNNQIFPIACAIVDSENDESWCWFFRMLRITLGLGSSLSIISDRHKSIMKAVGIELPGAQHGICMYHLGMNIVSKFKKKSLLQLFTRCAKSYSVSECQKFLIMIDSLCPGVKEYLMDVGLDKWSRAHFRGMRYNIMTTNTSESFNARIREARTLPVVPLLMEVRNILQQWFYERKCAANAMGTSLSTWADNQLRDEMARACHQMVKCVDLQQYEIMEGSCTHFVDIAKKTCSCRKWQLEQIPCSHVCAALKHMNMSPIKYTSKYFFKTTLLETYVHVIYPIGNPSEWGTPAESTGYVIKPPNIRRPAGRPRSRRFLPHHERGQSKKCGRCGVKGHNRKSCRNGVLDSS